MSIEPNVLGTRNPEVPPKPLGGRSGGGRAKGRSRGQRGPMWLSCALAWPVGSLKGGLGSWDPIHIVRYPDTDSDR